MKDFLFRWICSYDKEQTFRGRPAAHQATESLLNQSATVKRFFQKKWNKVKASCDVLSGLCVKWVAALVDGDVNGEWALMDSEVRGCEARRKFGLSFSKIGMWLKGKSDAQVGQWR